MNDLTFYESMKDRLSSCDVIEFRGTSLISKEIRAKTGYDTNHTALVIVMESPYTGVRRRYLHEAIDNGIKTNYLSDVLANYNGIAYWYPLRPELKVEIPQMEELAFRDVGIDYDYPALGQILLFGHCKIDTHRLFCSEYVQVVNGGVPDKDTAWWPGEVIEKMGRWESRVQITT